MTPNQKRWWLVSFAFFCDAVLVLIVWTRSVPWWMVAIFVTLDCFTHALRASLKFSASEAS